MVGFVNFLFNGTNEQEPMEAAHVTGNMCKAIGSYRKCACSAWQAQNVCTCPNPKFQTVSSDAEFPTAFFCISDF